MSVKGATLIVPSAVAAVMAGWQLHRMQWKAEVVAEAARNMQQLPVDLFQEAVPEFRRVALTGTYDHSKAAFVGPRPLSYEPKDPVVRVAMREVLMQPGAIKSGFMLVEPLISQDKQHSVLVNRGWVPPSWKTDWHKPSLQQQQPQGPVTVTGVVQGSEQPSEYVPKNDPQAGSFFWMDVGGLANAFDLPANTPMLQVLVDDAAGLKGEQPSTTGSVYPLPKPISKVVQFSTMPIGHFNYAIGWGCMSATMAYLALKVLRKGKGK